MNYMTLGKTLYKAMVFGILLATVFALSVPSAFVMAAYPTTDGQYSTGPEANQSSWTFGSAPSASGYSGQYGNAYPNTNQGNANQGNTCLSCNPGGPNVIVPDSVPVVSTEPAINVTRTSALIQGAAHVDSGFATVWFEWGTRVDNLDFTTRNVRIDNMSTGSSEMLTNLTPGTKYFYRVVVHNSTGTCKGLLRSFVTPGAIAAAKTTKTTSTTHVANTTVAANTSPSNNSAVYNGDIKGNLSVAAANASSHSSRFVPGSILGWLLVIILVFAIVVVVRKIQIEAEQRKQAAA